MDRRSPDSRAASCRRSRRRCWRRPVAAPRQGYRERMVERQVEAVAAPPPTQRFKEGDRVRHPSFGSGVVMKSTLTRTDEELVVRFEKVGVKILSAVLAPLTRG